MTLTAALRLVQPRAPMGKVDVPYLVTHTNKDGSLRHYFAPRQQDRRHGWATVRLHDRFDRPIRDAVAAAEACTAVATVYRRWRAGETDAGPHRIDKLGRVVEAPAKRKRGSARSRLYRPGQVGAMVTDYIHSDVFKDELGDKTQQDYRIYLGLFAAEFGETDWRQLAPAMVRKWLRRRAAEGGPAGAHALYRAARALFGKVRLIYDSVDHPGFVPAHANPLVDLDLGLPTGTILPWPRAAVDAFVALADAEGEPSIGDAIVMMSWLGVRRQDWLAWPADFFDRELIAFRQVKTEIPNVLPWSMVPALAARVAAAKARRTADAVAATTFFHNRDGRPWADAVAFRKVFNGLRAKLVETHPTFPTRFYVGLVEGEPLALPAGKLAMRTMRHTCVTFCFDAGIPSQLIGGITGHSQDEIDQILAHYRARTADQAAAALQLRMDHEAKEKTA